MRTTTSAVDMSCSYPGDDAGSPTGMASHDIDTVLGWRGRDVLDVEGDKIGRLGDVYLDEHDRPAWAGVRTGLFGVRESLLPLEGMREEGDDLQVPWEKALVKDAPNVDADVALEADEERRLFEHYGRGDAGPLETDPDAASVVRSEEEPVVTDRVERRPTERVTLKKVRVREHVERKIPVQREVVEVVEDPPADAREDRGAGDDPDARGADDDPDAREEREVLDTRDDRDVPDARDARDAER